jgi:hypothetical protein
VPLNSFPQWLFNVTAPLRLNPYAGRRKNAADPSTLLVGNGQALGEEEVAATIEQASRFVPVERLYPCTNCGIAPMDRSLAIGKLVALNAGAALVRGRFGSQPR